MVFFPEAVLAAGFLPAAGLRLTEKDDGENNQGNCRDRAEDYPQPEQPALAFALCLGCGACGARLALGHAQGFEGVLGLVSHGLAGDCDPDVLYTGDLLRGLHDLGEGCSGGVLIPGELQELAREVDAELAAVLFHRRVLQLHTFRDRSLVSLRLFFLRGSLQEFDQGELHHLVASGNVPRHQYQLSILVQVDPAWRLGRFTLRGFRGGLFLGVGGAARGQDHYGRE